MPDPPEPTVFVVDDDAAVRRSLKVLLEASGYRAETFASAKAFLETYAADRPGCLIADLRMPQLNGFALQGQLKARGIALPIIFLSAHGDVPAAVHAMRQGALAFLEKSVDTDELLLRVDEALALDAEARAAAARHGDLARRVAELTPREGEVMAHMVEGRINKEIAHALGISVKTVEIHRARVMQKMEAGSLAELVRMALEVGEPSGNGADPDGNGAGPSRR
jgi:two-component system response regulator FixJ